MQLIDKQSGRAAFARNKIPLRSPTDKHQVGNLKIQRTRTTNYLNRPKQCSIQLPERYCGKALPAPSSRESVALFHTTAPAYKRKARESEPEENDKGRGKGKGQKAQQGNGAAVAAADQDGDPNGPKHPPANPDEPLDFADVQSRLGSHDAHFRDAMKKLRTGGRFNPDAIGSLRVAPDRKKPGITYPLHELAQVVPHAGGRTISILAYEEESVKPIMSAVQASPDFNQQPQRDADNELELVLKIEPESRDDVLKRVKATCHDWREKLRAVRQRRDKIHVAWRKEGLLGPDLKRTVDKQLDKLIKTKMTEIDDLEKETMKATESK
ncbi:ribosome-recycling factor [Parahypoxylon ruwenzoriense]